MIITKLLYENTYYGVEDLWCVAKSNNGIYGSFEPADWMLVLLPHRAKSKQFNQSRTEE